MYNDRDLSWLNFNNRVLLQAADNTLPLMERVRFLSIFSSNLDEFFRVRFPLISIYSKLTEKQRKKIIPPPESELESKIQAVVDGQLSLFGQILNGEIVPLLKENNIQLYYNTPIPEKFYDELRDYFYAKILSFVEPVFIYKSLDKDFFPKNNHLYLMVTLSVNDEDALNTHVFVNIPSDKLGRFHTIKDDGVQHIFFIDDIMRIFLKDIFRDYVVKDCYSFKITRDAWLNLDEENYKGSLLDEIEKKVAEREKGRACRLLFQETMPIAVQHMMANAFGLNHNQLFSGGPYHNLSDFMHLKAGDDTLNYRPLPLISHTLLTNYGNIFKSMEENDVLLHFPYQSYNPVLSFFNQAAIDPEVASIKVTLYRVASESLIANALMSAAKNGKEVIVFVELKARFDEANNVRWARQMKRAGVKIIYSIPGIKVHSKIALVTRKKSSGQKKYAFIGTGNFNENTARFYADHALLTTNEAITADINSLFDLLIKSNKTEKINTIHLNNLLVSQNNLVDTFTDKINEQVIRHKKGLSSLIRIKVNNLEDPGIINQLYKASQEGVPVELLVRSICCIKPNMPGLSENIRVKRIVDRYLEHSRIFIFGTDDNKTVFMGSADLMTRSLYKRIEVLTPILNEAIANELEEYFDLQWNDETSAFELDENAKDIYPSPIEGVTSTYTVQEKLHKQLKENQQHAQPVSIS